MGDTQAHIQAHTQTLCRHIDRHSDTQICIYVYIHAQNGCRYLYKHSHPRTGAVVVHPFQASSPAFLFSHAVSNYPRARLFYNHPCMPLLLIPVRASGAFTSCHLVVMVPTWFQRNTIIVAVVAGALLFFSLIVYVFIRRKLRARYLLAKAERRRSRRSSEEEGKA
jgi:hypothetical protein